MFRLFLVLVLGWGFRTNLESRVVARQHQQLTKEGFKVTIESMFRRSYHVNT
jgi:hypothetical protein